MSYILRVGNVPWDTTEEELISEFEDFGEVISIKLIKNWLTDDSKGYAFVAMAREQDGLDAIEDLDGSIFGGCRLKVAKAIQKRSAKFVEKGESQDDDEDDEISFGLKPKSLQKKKEHKHFTDNVKFGIK